MLLIDLELATALSDEGIGTAVYANRAKFVLQVNQGRLRIWCVTQFRRSALQELFDLRRELDVSRKVDQRTGASKVLDSCWICRES